MTDDIKNFHHGNSEHDDVLDDSINAETLPVLATDNKSRGDIYRGPKGK